MRPSLRLLSLADLERLCQLDARCFALPWPKSQFEAELVHDQARVWGMFDQDQLLGAVCFRDVFDEVWIFRIMVDPAYTRQGFAGALLERAKSYAQAYDPPKALWLEVEVGNLSAIACYQKLGFETQAIRPNYYPLPNTTQKADALIMRYVTERLALDYELIDFGDGERFERFGAMRVVRPQREIAQPRQLANWQYDLKAEAGPKGSYHWEIGPSGLKDWAITMPPLRFSLRLSASKNIGLFPEQVDNWSWVHQQIATQKRPIRLLNLFAYTGAASLMAAYAGAEVCHVDASKSAVRWASENLAQSALLGAKIRWIVDDAAQFLAREVQRGRTYDAIILDPPPFGHAKNGQFVFEKQVEQLLGLCKQVLSPEPLLVVLNCYALNYTPKQASDLLSGALGRACESGTLSLKTKDARSLSCSVYARIRF